MPIFAVRDMSNARVTIQPAEFGSWADARAELITEEKRPLKAQMEAEIADACGDDEAIANIRKNFASQERVLESEIDHKPLEFHRSLGMSYNVCFVLKRSRARQPPLPCPLTRPPVFCAAVPFQVIKGPLIARTHARLGRLPSAARNEAPTRFHP